MERPGVRGPTERRTQINLEKRLSRSKPAVTLAKMGSDCLLGVRLRPTRANFSKLDQSLDPAQELSRFDRLDQICAGALPESPLTILIACGARAENNGHRRIVLTDAAAQCEAVQVGQPTIQHVKIKRAAAGHV
jgi:hypothetical protein